MPVNSLFPALDTGYRASLPPADRASGRARFLAAVSLIITATPYLLLFPNASHESYGPTRWNRALSCFVVPLVVDPYPMLSNSSMLWLFYSLFTSWTIRDSCYICSVFTPCPLTHPFSSGVHTCFLVYVVYQPLSTSSQFIHIEDTPNPKSSSGLSIRPRTTFMVAPAYLRGVHLRIHFWRMVTISNATEDLAVPDRKAGAPAIGPTGCWGFFLGPTMRTDRECAIRRCIPFIEEHTDTSRGKRRR